MKFFYMAANRVSGYSGFVDFVSGGKRCYWMIPGTFFNDWDN